MNTVASPVARELFFFAAREEAGVLEILAPVVEDLTGFALSILPLGLRAAGIVRGSDISSADIESLERKERKKGL